MFFLKSFRFSREEENRISNCIKKAESGTTGEIRLLVTRSMPEGDPVEFVRKKFFDLNMHRISEKNAVLFVICLKQRKIAVWGGEALQEMVPENYWTEQINLITKGFKEGKGTDALCNAILQCGEILQRFFPIKNNQNPNELPDGVAYDE